MGIQALSSGLDFGSRVGWGRQQSVSASRGTSLDLTVTTAEGDTVTLSAKALQSLAASETRTDSSYARQYSRSNSIELSVQVGGDLNAEELQDLKEVARAVVSSIRQASRGNTDQALRTLAKAAGQDTIATATFRYVQQQQYDYARRLYDAA